MAVENPKASTCLYFGTFNPIHAGHLMIAQAALRQYGPVLGFQTVSFIPAGQPPHRHHENDLLDAYRRLGMVRLATADHPDFRVLDLEVNRPGQSFTIDTVNHLINQGVVSKPVPFIIGTDALRGLTTWHKAKSLVEKALFLQAPRPHCEPVRALSFEGPDQDLLSLNTSMIDMPMLAISSTWIRQILKEKREQQEALRYFLPEPVRRFIEDNGLYL